jgi:PadR family transcriptional regulator, regulatory protein PadR
MNFKGTLPTLILEALAQGPSHGYAIAQSIKSRTKGVLDFKEGTLYPALHKLDSAGHIESYEGITKTGRTLLAKDRAEWRAISQAVTVILGEA